MTEEVPPEPSRVVSFGPRQERAEQVTFDRRELSEGGNVRRLVLALVNGG